MKCTKTILRNVRLMANGLSITLRQHCPPEMGMDCLECGGEHREDISETMTIWTISSNNYLTVLSIT